MSPSKTRGQLFNDPDQILQNWPISVSSTHPFLQHLHVDDNVCDALAADQDLQDQGQVHLHQGANLLLSVKDVVDMVLQWKSDDGDLLRRVVEPEHDGDDHHGEDEEDDDANCNVDEEVCDNAVGGVHLREVGTYVKSHKDSNG